LGFLADFLRSQKLIKKHIFSKPHKISKNSTMGAQGLDVGHFLAPCGHPVFIKFRDSPNLLNCNKHGVKTLLLPLLASHFGIENPLKIHVFSRHPPGPNFSSFYMNLCQKARFWDPFKIHWAAKLRPKSAHWRQHVDNFLVLIAPSSVFESDP
jgi:hypothetical protein